MPKRRGGRGERDNGVIRRKREEGTKLCIGGEPMERKECVQEDMNRQIDV